MLHPQAVAHRRLYRLFLPPYGGGGAGGGGGFFKCGGLGLRFLNRIIHLSVEGSISLGGSAGRVVSTSRIAYLLGGGGGAGGGGFFRWGGLGLRTPLIIGMTLFDEDPDFFATSHLSVSIGERSFTNSTIFTSFAGTSIDAISLDSPRL